MKPRGRRVALAAAALGLLTLAGAGVAFKGRVVEEWYIRQLESEDEEKKELAAERLGEMGSRRAIPRLIEISRRGGVFGGVDSTANGKFVVAASGDGTVRMWDAATGKVISAVDSRSHYGIRALVKIGRPAVPALLRVLGDNDEGKQLAVAEVLGEIGPEAAEAVPALRKLTNSPSSVVSYAAATALKKIQGEER